MMGWEEDLTGKKAAGVPLFRGTSCVGQPAVNALKCIRLGATSKETGSFG